MVPLNTGPQSSEARARPEDAPPRCLVCGSAEAGRVYRITRFHVLRCRSCQQVYLWPLLDEQEVQELFVDLYSTGEGSVPELRDYYGYCYEDTPDNPLVQLYERWLARIEERHAPGRLLDVGCGTGLFLAVARRRGWQTFGVDECADALRHARDHFDLDVRQGSFETLGLEGKTFDAVTMWDIIEHARAPIELLRTVRTHLAPGGVVGISTPNRRSILDVVAGSLYRLSLGRITRPLEKFYIEQHFLYFDPESLSAALERAGLRMVGLERELTDLRRLHLTPAKRLVLETLFQIARRTRLENRLFAVAEAA